MAHYELNIVEDGAFTYVTKHFGNSGAILCLRIPTLFKFDGEDFVKDVDFIKDIVFHNAKKK